jgi:predicted ABC-type transport system involved in lysophospholipase L1 biosynthesis ATPase subunit
MSEPLLQAHGVRKTYRSGDHPIEVLRGVELAIAAGESLSIRGESGSGKSTLLHVLAGLDAPDAGVVSWEGSGDLGPRRRGRFLGLVFQAFYLVPELDARENVWLAARINGLLDGAARRRGEELLQRVGLGERMRHLPSELSGGERQRVALARALLNRPRVILADEPTGNLDERTADEAINLLLGLCGDTGTALVLVTHNPAYAARTGRQQTLHEGILH